MPYSGENKSKYPYYYSRRKTYVLVFLFRPILNFANYTRSPLSMRIRLIGSNALSKISANILIVIGGDRRCLPLLVDSLI